MSNCKPISSSLFRYLRLAGCTLDSAVAVVAAIIKKGKLGMWHDWESQKQGVSRNTYQYHKAPILFEKAIAPDK